MMDMGGIPKRASDEQVMKMIGSAAPLGRGEAFFDFSEEILSPVGQRGGFNFISRARFTSTLCCGAGGGRNQEGDREGGRMAKG